MAKTYYTGMLVRKRGEGGEEGNGGKEIGWREGREMEGRSI